MTPFARPLNIGLLVLALLCPAWSTQAGEAVQRDKNPADQPNLSSEESAKPGGVEFDWELDPYYSNIGWYIPLSDQPIPDVGDKPELEVYRDLTLSSAIPSFLVVEASVNPMPMLGVAIHDKARSNYDSAQVNSNFNWIRALTAGFEEPWAVSLFAGKVVSFTRPGETHAGGNKGYTGWLFSGGTQHIKANTLVDDPWWELEWKIKGDREIEAQELHWSFRVGAKVHSNPNIADVFYVALRRSRTDFDLGLLKDSFLRDFGFEYIFDMRQSDLKPMRHYLVFDRKFPFDNARVAFSIEFGFVWESVSKYSGPLADPNVRVNDFQYLIRPNFEF